MVFVPKKNVAIRVSTALFIAAFVAGCDQGAASASSNSPPSEVVRGTPIRSDKIEPPGEKPSVNGAKEKPAVDAQQSPQLAAPGTSAANVVAEKKSKVSAPSTPTKPASELAPNAKPDISSFTRPKKLPKDDKTPVGVPDKERPEILRVNFDDLASFDYDPYEAAPPELAKPSQSPNQGAAVSNAAAAETHEEHAGPSSEPPPKPVLNEQLPARIMALNKKKILIQGFMVPIEFKRDSVRSFLLVRNQMMCCFGAMMGMNEWVLVQMDGEKKTSYVQDVPTTVMGELEVGEDFQGGMVMSIYRMRAFEVTFKGGR